MPTAPRVDPNAFVQQPVDFGGAIDSFARGLDRGRQIKRQKEMDAEAKRIQKLNEQRQKLEDEQREIENARREEAHALNMQAAELRINEQELRQKQEREAFQAQKAQLAKLEMDFLEVERGEDGRIVVPTDEYGLPSDPHLATLSVLDNFYTQQPTEGAEFMSVVLPPEAVDVYQTTYSNLTENITTQRAQLMSARNKAEADAEAAEQARLAELKAEEEKVTQQTIKIPGFGSLNLPATQANEFYKEVNDRALQKMRVQAMTTGIPTRNDEGKIELWRAESEEEAIEKFPDNLSVDPTSPAYKSAIVEAAANQRDTQANKYFGLPVDPPTEGLARLPTTGGTVEPLRVEQATVDGVPQQVPVFKNHQDAYRAGVKAYRIDGNQRIFYQ